MKHLTIAIIFLSLNSAFAQLPSKVDYLAYEQLVQEVKDHREQRLIPIEVFNTYSLDKDVLILDTRSAIMYEAKHIKGAVHLNFSDFTQKNLESIIPSKETKILIYCNNNFDNDEVYFPTKMYVPPTNNQNDLGITMALNIPTYINLYGYGYKNVYELSELVSIFDERVQLEGIEVPSEGN